jgi:O-antigen/teichoic acid export membrane protein
MRFEGRWALLAHFVAGRGLQFLAPVVAANVLAISAYGAVEWGHAAGSLASTVLMLGLAALVPFVMLRSDARGTLVAVQLHATALGFCCFFGALIAAALFGVGAGVMALLFTGTLALQGVWTYVLRARGDDTASLYLEAAPFTLVAVAAAASAQLLPKHATWVVAGSLSAALLVLLTASVRDCLRHLERQDAVLYLQSVSAAVPLMLGGLLTMLATTSGRLGIGLLGSTELTGAFSAIARVAALPVVAHQLALVASFRNLYAMPAAELQPLMLRVHAWVAAAVVLLLVALPWVHSLLGSAFSTAALAHPVATVLLVTQVVLWSGVALNDLVAARHEQLPRLLPWTAAALCISLALAAAAMGWLGVTVDNFAACHTAVMAVLFATQSLVMVRLGVNFLHYWAACAGSFVVITGLALAWQFVGRN